ncbi:nucleoside hydrolase [Mycoplasmatota bacterium]|nr:nucleoside hydrolase [Mycoplasmatota bacterium]
MKKIILDVDPGIDDSLAILLAAKSDLNIVGITVASGNVEVNQGSINAIKALEIAGRDIPVYKGAELPLVRDYVDATDTHGPDGLSGMNYKVKGKANDGAIDFILDTIKENPNEVTICALGPLTNLALAIEKDIETMRKVGRIVVMGGAAKIHGNCSPVAEYNFWVDPHAAKRFFKANLPNVTVAGLDVTYDILFSPNMREMVKQFGGEVAQYVYDITQFYVDFHWEQERTLGCIINDPLLVSYLIDESIMKAYPCNIDVETEDLCIGESVVGFDVPSDFDGDYPINAKMCMEVDKVKFFDVFFKTIFPEHVADYELMKKKGYILK